MHLGMDTATDESTGGRALRVPKHNTQTFFVIEYSVKIIILVTKIIIIIIEERVGAGHVVLVGVV